MADAGKQFDSILVVDGDVLVRHAIADYLRSCGYTVIEAASTEEAKTVLEGANPVGAMLCDAEAPGELNSFQLRTWAKQQRQSLQVVLAASVEAIAQTAADLCEEGPQLARPYDPQSVVEYVRRVLGTKRLSDARTG